MASNASVASWATTLEGGRLSIGRVFERAWLFVRRNPGLTITLSVLLGAMPAVAVTYVLQQIGTSALVVTFAGYPLPGAVALFLLELFAGLFLGVLLQGAMITPILADAEGSHITVASAAASFFRNLWPLILLGLLTGIAGVIGTTLLIVPAIIVYLLWSIAPSALVAERDGLFLALDRSHDLIRGVRWKVFALLLILEVVNIVISLSAVLGARLFLGIGPRLQDSPGYTAVLLLVNIISFLMWATVQASLYVELVRWKEGNSPESLHEVFA